MSWIFDQKYLQSVQYRSASHLEARINLHKRFGMNEVPWTEWLAGQVSILPGCRVVDIGCGPGTLWRENQQRLPAGKFVLADLSLGMVKTSAASLAGDSRFSFLQADAQHLPLPDSCFDLAFANHMLYHVPDIHLALTELRRVLKPGGWLCAATNGKNHMRELDELIQKHLPAFSLVERSRNRFGLEMGTELVAEHFQQTRMIQHDNDLWVTETQPLVEYILSMWGTLSEDMTWLENLAAEVEAHIQREGGLRISRAGGVILARNG